MRKSVKRISIYNVFFFYYYIMVYSNKNYCSTSTNYQNGSCFKLEDLKIIAKELKIKNYVGYTHKKLWNKIKKILSECSTEVCWIKHPRLKKIFDKNIKFSNTNNKSLKHSIQFFRFKPIKPDEDGHNTWLSTIDIEHLLNQLDKKYSDFKFIGAVPINFDDDIGKINDITTNICVTNELCKLDINNLIKEGIRKIGIVFNMDPHYKGGSHWTSLFIEINDNNKNKKDKYASVEYFDSFGLPPKTEIKNLIERVSSDLKKEGYRIIHKLNKIKFQENNTECGVYSIYTIRERVMGCNYDNIIKKLKNIKITNKNNPDNKMSSLRNVFFLPREIYNTK
jgi:hypothetical protein